VEVLLRVYAKCLDGDGRPTVHMGRKDGMR